MKKLLLILIVSIFCATSSFAQYDITFGVPDVDVTALNPGDDVIVPVIMVERMPTGVPGSFVIGFDLFIGFDHAILTWKGTNPAPLPGAQNFHPMCPFSPADWTFNDNGTEMVALWQDPTYLGADFENGAVLFEYIFTYNGGLNPGDASPLVWGVSKSLQGEKNIKMSKGITNAFTDFFATFDNVFLLDGSVFIGGEVTKVWTGAISDDWSEDGNWNPAGAPTATDDVEISDVTKAPAPVIYGSAACAALTLNPLTMLTVGAGGELTTNGVFTNLGDFVIASDGLGYSGSFIDLGGMVGTGTYSFNRDIVSTAAYGAMGGWHFLSTPIAGFENWDMYDYFANKFDGATQMYDPIEGTYTPEPGVPCDPAPQTVLAPMEAWSIKQDVTYATGTNFLGYDDDCETEYPGTGTVIELAGPFTNVNTGAFGPMTVFTGWNFFGNPYSSSIDPSMISFGANTVQSISMWDGLATNYYYWTAAVPANNIAPTQGFFVEATGADNFSLAGTERIHDAAGTSWGKSEIANLLTLQATGNDKSDILYVRFMDEMTPAFDNNGDAHKLISEVPGVPQIYTTVGSEMLAINALPATEQVPMGFISAESGSFTIEAIETSEFSEVYLQDLVTGQITDMLAHDYSFDYTAGENANRFIIHFAPVGINEMNTNTVKIWALDNNIIVNVPAAVTGEIAVFNIMGQEVVRTEIESVETQIPVSDVNTYYVVKVISDSNAVTGKVYVK